MTRALLSIIGEPIGYVDVIDGPSAEVGFSLNPAKAVGGVVRSVKRTVKKVNKAIDKTPVLSDIKKATTQGISLQTTPFRLAGGFVVGGITGMAKGGVKGAVKGAVKGVKHQGEVTVREGKRFVQNPAVRYGTKGAALIFPPLTPVAAGVEAANQVIAAIEQRDPIKAAFALTTVANTAAAASAGDPDAMRAIKTISAVKKGALTAKDTIDEGKVMATKLGARFNIPKGAKALNVAKAADKLLSKAKGKGNIPQVQAAQAIVRQTVAAAKAGDPKAKIAAVALAKVNRAQNVKAGKVPAKKPLPVKKAPTFSLSAASKAVGKALRLGKGKKLSNVFIVDAKGKVYRGNVTTQ